MDFEETLTNPLPGMIPWRSSQQVIISLRKFAKTMKTVKAKNIVTNGPARGVTLTPDGIKDAIALDDVSDLLGASMTDIDTSLAGVVKRVGLLLFLLIGFGAGLFYLGLEYMFPK